MDGLAVQTIVGRKSKAPIIPSIHFFILKLHGSVTNINIQQATKVDTNMIGAHCTEKSYKLSRSDKIMHPLKIKTVFIELNFQFRKKAQIYL